MDRCPVTAVIVTLFHGPCLAAGLLSQYYKRIHQEIRVYEADTISAKKERLSVAVNAPVSLLLREPRHLQLSVT
jgi:hypothetical protein